MQQLEGVLGRAAAAGVERIITIGTDPRDAAAAIRLCRGKDSVRCAVGVHPNHCHEVDERDLPILRELQADPVVVAIGEMGLDYHHEFTDRSRQRRFFEAQLALADDVGKPAVIHCRDAVDDCLSVMRGFAGLGAVFHCFTGSVAEAEQVLRQGYLLGFAGVVTFKKSDELREVARRAPADRILVETDAPYLAPEPVRKQKINEPALVVHTAAAVAAARGVSLEEIDRITTQNVKRVFGWG